MSLLRIFQISAQGMTAQRERLEVAASNLANAHTTRTAEGGPYRRRDVRLEAVATEQGRELFALFPSLVRDSSPDGSGADFRGAGVRARIEVAASDLAERRFQPGHPDAGADGYVQIPAVDPLEETVNMLSATRSFEASATAFNTAKELVRATLRLGENS